MEFLSPVLLQLATWIKPYLGEISLAIVATILVVYGDVLNKLIKRHLNPYHFIVRTLGFVIICAFGYGALTVFATPYIKSLLQQLPSLYLAPTVIVVFSLLGFLAERKRYI